MSVVEEICLYPALTLIGALTVCYLAVTLGWQLIRGFRVHFLSSWWKSDLRQYGNWAVVTGATDGIGKSYAEELARRGLNIVLISRSMEKLQRVAKEIEQQSGRKTKIIQADFTGGDEVYTPIEKGIKAVSIFSIAVNNVGMKFHDEPIKFIDAPNLRQKSSHFI
ncbi:hypothetical protein GDO86_017975 [Hymenochirus boettgeri]|uniref:Uncharacterized protein n=1 Tax=Hymenochirus boettgeri TaxID=247094 RepID=A0A8T2IIX1_9PIPI|nr:hypothetical protein GDO86_017975 [Hymenochirus boettgeri]